MELKMYTPVDPKFGFEKMKFKVLHYIQHDFICQCQGLSKDQISMFKSPVINQLLNGYIKIATTIFLYKSRCGKCSLEVKLFIKQSQSRVYAERSYLSHQAISSNLQKDQVQLINFQRGAKWVPSRFSIFDGFYFFFFPEVAMLM